MTKKELRILYRQKRLAISNKEKMKLDDLLLIQFQQLSFLHVELLLSYLPMQHTAEPDTSLYTRYLQHMLPHLQIAYPVTDFSNCTMQAILVNDKTRFSMNDYNITEPVEGSATQPGLIDAVFVPMLICDAKGYRAGYGKGFYDRYLQQCRKDVLKIGFSYFEPVAKIDDLHPFDIPLSYCITPYCTYEFQ